MFGLLPPIYTGCLTFLAQLEAVLAPAAWDPASTLLAPVFLEGRSYFEAYSPYVNSFTEIQTTLHRIMEKRSDFKAWIMDCRKLPRVADKYLIDFLIMPVQRCGRWGWGTPRGRAADTRGSIPRYSLLLRELVKQTPAVHPDYGGLLQALELVDGISTFLNEEKRKAEDFAVSRVLLKCAGRSPPKERRRLWRCRKSLLARAPKECK